MKLNLSATIAATLLATTGTSAFAAQRDADAKPSTVSKSMERDKQRPSDRGFPRYDERGFPHPFYAN